VIGQSFCVLANANCYRDGIEDIKVTLMALINEFFSDTLLQGRGRCKDEKSEFDEGKGRNMLFT
jgi:hypothetical protein